MRRVYGPLGSQPPVTTTTAAQGGGVPDAARAGAGSPAKPVLPRAGSEFTGLSRIGIVVEELSTQSVGCGLKRDEVEASVAKPFADVGVRAIRNGDEDTYLYVNIMTSTLPTGMFTTS